MNYIQRIEIDHNASAIMAIECVDSMAKLESGEYLYHFRDTHGSGYLFEGDSLAQDEDGHWHRLSKENDRTYHENSNNQF